MSEEKKYIGESPILGKPKKKILFRLVPIRWEQLDRSLQERIVIGGGSAVITNEEMDNVLGGEEERHVYLVDINDVEILDVNGIPIEVLA